MTASEIILSVTINSQDTISIMLDPIQQANQDSNLITTIWPEIINLRGIYSTLISCFKAGGTDTILLCARSSVDRAIAF